MKDPDLSRKSQAPSQPFPFSLLSTLRFPQLFAIFAALFLLDLLIPDLLPFVDEILLGILTLMTGTMKKRDRDPQGPDRHVQVDKPPEKNVTPASRQ